MSEEKYSLTIEKIREFFKRYSVQDIATSLFVSSLWLPNIASPVKHQFLTAIFASTNPSELSPNRKINNYKDFKKFINKVISWVPAFPMLEDFVPEPDWGDIRFHHQGQNHRFFYGNELSNVYDYLTLFSMVFGFSDEKFVEIISRSPHADLEACLNLQDHIITNITTQPQGDLSGKISPGDYQVPSLSFWMESSDFYGKFKPEEVYGSNFACNFSLSLGSYDCQYLEWNKFGDSVFSGKLLPFFFIEHQSKFFPILPRRYSSILFDHWSGLFRNNYQQVTGNNLESKINFSGQVHRYMKSRIRSDNIFPCFSTYADDEKAHELIFPTGFIAKDKLVVIYLTSPGVKGEEIEKELESIGPKLKEAEANLQRIPTSLLLNLSQEQLIIKSHEDKQLKPIFLVVIPQASTQIQSFSIPESFSGEITFLDQFLGVIDEIDEPDELASFLDYLDSFQGVITLPFTSWLDKFGSFRDSKGVLIDGALSPDMVVLDHQWGSNFRYKSLKQFWELYPPVDYIGHPRTWNLEKETSTRTRMISRGTLTSALYCQLGRVHLFVSGPLHLMSFEQLKMTNLLMETLEDAMSKHKAFLENLELFRYENQLRIYFYPKTFVETNDKFDHLATIIGDSDTFRARLGTSGSASPMLIVVFNEKLVSEILRTATDSSFECDLLCGVIKELNEIRPSPMISEILEKISEAKSDKPRFKIFVLQKPASFPEGVATDVPKDHSFKLVNNRIAELAKENGFLEGEYLFEEAKDKIKLIKDSVLAEINSEVSKLNFDQSVPFVLARIDALVNEYELEYLKAKRTVEHEVDYDLEGKLGESHIEYIRMHKNCRFLIEKLVQLQPSAQGKIDTPKYQYLLALIDWLHVFYQGSDNLHYGLNPAGMKVTNQYLVDVVYEEGFEEDQKIFSREFAENILGLEVNKDDMYTTTRTADGFLDKLDDHFVSDLGFPFRGMLALLHILSFWPRVQSETEESTNYSADPKVIEKICRKNIDTLSIQESEFGLIIDFLTLKPNDVVRTTGNNEAHSDLPVWEHRKRYARYGLKPLIQSTDGFVHWGPYSAYKSIGVWSMHLSSGMLPADLNSTNIQKVVEEEKELLGKGLVDQAFEIVNKFTSVALKDCYLHKIDPKGNHPLDLGDYDVLCFCPEKNVVLNIECKDILQAYCFKDSKRVREKIFGRPNKDRGYIGQVLKRQEYLENNLLQLAACLNWAIDEKNPPKICPIFLSRNDHWWTRFPPIQTSIQFLRIQMLPKFIEKLSR